jgi:hypothetical protein
VQEEEAPELEAVRQGRAIKADDGGGGRAISNKFEQLWGDEQDAWPALVSNPYYS